ncbi:MAG: STAS domain-containing protein [Oscillospiraceae bacterium]|jgi:stage II sporulation protein AA (anti-sigma F factor antagonist)|nr:STAS domain-containing protein [Oscillospiraceae bacterium]
MTVNTSFDDGTLTLRFEGELDHHAARGAVRDVERAIEAHLPRACVLNLDGLSFMDSSGIAVILKAHRRVSELGATLLVTGARAQPLKVLAAAKLERLITIEHQKELYI